MAVATDLVAAAGAGQRADAVADVHVLGDERVRAQRLRRRSLIDGDGRRCLVAAASGGEHADPRIAGDKRHRVAAHRAHDEDALEAEVDAPALLGDAFAETPGDLLMMEQAQCFDGLYFVLMGALSPLDGIGPRDIHLERLLHRAGDGVVEEVVLATNFTGEGEATAHVIAEMLKKRGLRVTRLARGVPAGSELEYVDLGTIAHALVDRR